MLVQDITRRLIRVQREWNGWQVVDVPVDELHDIHWFQPEGAPQPLVHGFVPETSMHLGHLAPAAEGATARPAVRVCVLKKHNCPDVYQEVQERAYRPR